MTPAGILILVVLILVVLAAPRRWALLGMIAGVLYLTQAQQTYVLGFKMFAIRFLELAGFTRVMGRGEFSFSRLGKIDRTLLLLYSYTTIVYLLRATEGQAYAIGLTMDACLCYFTFRGLIGEMEDFRWFLRAFVVLLVPFVCLVLIEALTAHNLFTVMSGMPDEPWFREGSVRCHGSFRHPSLLGTLGASFFPLYIALALAETDRMVGWIGVGLSLTIVWASTSGGPLGMVATGAAGWVLWIMRRRMRLVRLSIVGLIVLAALLMKAPVWYLLARLSSFTGGDGWHRSYLIDVAFRHLREWWFDGIPTEATVDWFPYTLASTGGADLTNQFISFGIIAGVGALGLFVCLLSRAFSALGKALANIRSHSSETNRTELLVWGMGVMLAAHVTNWFGISYWDQTYVLWFMQLAAITNLSEQYADNERMAAETAVSSEPDALWLDDVVEPGVPLNAGGASPQPNR